MEHFEEDRIELVKEYFERGCLCILSGELEKHSGGQEAVTFYEQNCKCSRNYKDLEGF